MEKEKETGQSKKNRENDGDFPIHIPNNNERDCAAYDTKPLRFRHNTAAAAFPLISHRRTKNLGLSFFNFNVSSLSLIHTWKQSFCQIIEKTNGPAEKTTFSLSLFPFPPYKY